MKQLAGSVLFLFWVAMPCDAQTFTDLESYCRAISEMSSTMLVARTSGLSRAEAELPMKGMTDPLSIRLVKEALDYAYSRPTTMSIDAMRAELRNLCMAKKIFVQ